MATVDLKPRVIKFIKTLPPKQQRQIKGSLLALKENPLPHDSKKLVGYEYYRRTDAREYRIIYQYNEEQAMVVVVLVGKRNDGEVYKIVKRL